ncbi:MAG: 2-dehydro-3-deoxy-6-phosphogalactonate aldolase [Hoeflea sp.]|uniref:2-dehydro-3-deoxy-6-phosphogalactonate aldolase n=1 Tax=Hoeflea sp. TaxID=1940281 RepID=UPI001DF135D9|nr:2-dehydro-3-deoxy-6-phosphogalactonate aldolase [Hoeflea sp.]MBU4529097.1 2-dehydro-3-deoxy-6-phosphogalactonate aldolase [Alphaproteobacteria bacterium]MBU4543502.1 2-dehydro-3-deoxy-6-phosphogalactonate aldolase [Alphaproteobacteria bacterium]MBU4549127.1 2-dehydro-3-deoxy-6-phosphogalactonate aldolase [Alphaproteobacteria bacterium]MBV1725262.1 2-dehydro-3-deoxy-6-phosphogalactonate aldolase [Hoeflea sp.]MBV1785223.1 2-dehydro-3-deoxy-6-phosphogalactonate aldolase [Hoeflea sp.]
MIRIKFPSMKRSLVAILRGIKPDETAAIVDGLIEAGFTAIEIPLNSPDPFRSIEIAARRAPKDVLIGAGTVLTTDDADRLNDVGGRLMVSPNVDAQVIAQATSHGMVTMPGVFTPTEALAACAAGASALKFFPANVLGPSGINAIRAVLPKDVAVGAVGGVSNDDFAAYAKAGIRTFGLGSSLYKAGMEPGEVKLHGVAAIRAYDALEENGL